MRIGKITENALKRSVLKQIRTEYKDIKSAAVGSDCAFFNDKKTFSATFPVVADIKDAGFYAVIKAVNSLVAQGITADHVTLTVLLPADSEEKELKKIVSDALLGSRTVGVPYVGGHTEVTGAVTRPVITATAVGFAGDNTIVDSKPKAGQALIVTKWIALEGTAILAGEKKNELATRYPVPFIEEAERFKALLPINSEAAVAIKSGASSVHDLSSGGIFAALWEMAERAGTGLNVDLKKIPIRQETIEVCEFLEVNPYLLTSGGGLLIATDDEEKALSELEKADINAAVIGYLREGNDRIIVNGEEQRFLELPQADEIHRILL
ncbi:AIR synthase-related protein [Butyrivibrio sp. CB08]|uniref:AIR synthase-related protein n=1 Tax=Butyrivibrio sp. CB08 TaxID=2364879 RepID=UPI001314CB6F|nr:AIR synthase-related protein [Butyrivibrio sp. CB08]